MSLFAIALAVIVLGGLFQRETNGKIRLFSNLLTTLGYAGAITLAVLITVRLFSFDTAGFSPIEALCVGTMTFELERPVAPILILFLFTGMMKSLFGFNNTIGTSKISHSIFIASGALLLCTPIDFPLQYSGLWFIASLTAALSTMGDAKDAEKTAAGIYGSVISSFTLMFSCVILANENLLDYSFFAVIAALAVFMIYVFASRRMAIPALCGLLMLVKILPTETFALSIILVSAFATLAGTFGASCGFLNTKGKIASLRLAWMGLALTTFGFGTVVYAYNDYITALLAFGTGFLIFFNTTLIDTLLVFCSNVLDKSSLQKPLTSTCFSIALAACSALPVFSTFTAISFLLVLLSFPSIFEFSAYLTKLVISITFLALFAWGITSGVCAYMAGQADDLPLNADDNTKEPFTRQTASVIAMLLAMLSFSVWSPVFMEFFTVGAASSLPGFVTLKDDFIMLNACEVAPMLGIQYGFRQNNIIFTFLIVSVFFSIARGFVPKGRFMLAWLFNILTLPIVIIQGLLDSFEMNIRKPRMIFFETPLYIKKLYDDSAAGSIEKEGTSDFKSLAPILIFSAILSAGLYSLNIKIETGFFSVITFTAFIIFARYCRNAVFRSSAKYGLPLTVSMEALAYATMFITLMYKDFPYAIAAPVIFFILMIWFRVNRIAPDPVDTTYRGIDLWIIKISSCTEGVIFAGVFGILCSACVAEGGNGNIIFAVASILSFITAEILTAVFRSRISIILPFIAALLAVTAISIKLAETCQ